MADAKRQSIERSKLPILGVIALVCLVLGVGGFVHGAEHAKFLLILGATALGFVIVIWFWRLITARKSSQAKRLTALGAGMTLIVMAMLGFSYGMVPLFDLITRAFDIGGKVTQQAAPAEKGKPVPPVNKGVDRTRTVSLQILTTRNARLPWHFESRVKSVDIYPGEQFNVRLYLRNDAKHAITAHPQLSVAPSVASKFLVPVTDFDDHYTLGPGETKEVTTRYQLNRDLPRDVRQLTMAFTWFDVTRQGAYSLRPKTLDKFGKL